jgi:hypothetical protein
MENNDIAIWCGLLVSFLHVCDYPQLQACSLSEKIIGWESVLRREL